MSSNSNNNNDEETATSTEKQQQQQQQQQQDPKLTNYQAQTWNPLRLLVLRLGFTEPAWTSPLNHGKKDGTFKCAYCGNTLFDSNAYYDSGRYVLILIQNHTKNDVPSFVFFSL
jgi:peptide methionine sulfoxide reductase MsrB